MMSIPIWRRIDLVFVWANKNGCGKNGRKHRTWHAATRVFLNYIGRHAIVICPGYGLQWVGGGGSCAFIWTHWVAIRFLLAYGMRESRKTHPTTCFPKEYAEACGSVAR